MAQKQPIACIICGKQFIPTTPNAKYCSRDCAAVGNNANRRNWEQATGYLEKKRKYEQERRNRIKAEAEAEKARAAQIAAERRLQKNAEIEKQHHDALMKAAAAGDHFARMELAVKEHGNMSAEYWDAFAGYELAHAEACGMVSCTIVNGIEVNEPDFGQQVLQTIKEGGKIIVKTGCEKAVPIACSPIPEPVPAKGAQ